MKHCDVAIIGGGPGGTTVAGFLRKLHPELDVAIFERETFPRDHVGESLLPRVTQILHDLGVWDEMEAAEFPIKVGAKYRWGDTENMWDFDFIPGGKFEDLPRPGKYEGQRTLTAWQVDRATYDKILLDHARVLGAQVYENTKVTKVHFDRDRITHLSVAPTSDDGEGEEWTARYYVDASGSSGLLRRTLGIEVDSPTALRNVAIWDYWLNAEWAEHIGIGGTRIRVMSLGWGWIWFIPISPVRTSIGLVTPVSYIKSSGKKPEELYQEALAAEPDIQRLTRNATRQNNLQTTKDWNFISERLAGENWFLVGDSAGFADPILSAGLSLTHNAGLRVANCIAEIERGELDATWLKQDYSDSQRAQIRNHMAFAEFWYYADGKFADVVENCSKIAQESGLSLEPEAAFYWLGTGGFAHDALGAASSSFTRVAAIHHNINQMTGERKSWEVEKHNVFNLDTEGAEEVFVANHGVGWVRKVPCLKRGAALLPKYLAYGAMYESLLRENEFEPLLERFVFELKKTPLKQPDPAAVWNGIETLEAMVAEGWVKASFEPKLTKLKIFGTSQRTVYGWWKDGVGIMGIDLANRGRVMLSLEEMEKANSNLGRGAL